MAASADGPSPASPTTENPGSRSSSWRRPWRKIGWSSAMKMVIGSSHDGVLPSTAHREADGDRRACAGTRRHGVRAAEHRRSFGHADHAKPPGLDGRRSRHARRSRVPLSAMVSRTSWPLHHRADRSRRRVCVPDDIAQALLDDPIAVDRGVARDRAFERGDIDVDRKRRRCADARDHLLDRLGQAEPIEMVRTKVVGDLTHLVDGVAGGRGDLVELLAG